MARVVIEVSVGELIDKLTILELKVERIRGGDAGRRVQRELAMLEAELARANLASPELTRASVELRRVNTALWEVEDAIRDCERRGDFGAEFVELARSVYHCNDRRSALKREIDELSGSALTEEKSYAPLRRS